jgi:hypothetical protein
MEMEEQIQQNIYKALQDIEGVAGSSSARSSLNLQNAEAKDSLKNCTRKKI